MNTSNFERSRDRQFSGNFKRDDRSSSRSTLGSRTSAKRDRIGCFRCREYDDFAKDFPNKEALEKDQSDHIQPVMNMEDQSTEVKLFTERHTSI